MLSGSKHSELSKQKMSVSKKGRPGKLGYRFTDSQRENMRIAQRAIQSRDPGRMLRARAARKILPVAESAARERVRRMCKQMLRRVLLMARLRKDRKLELLIGYTKAELRLHLERQFAEDMSWEDYGSFHLDHIVPIAIFVKRGVSDPRIINALANLRPLPKKDNQQKSDLYDDRNFESDLAAIVATVPALAA